MVVLFLVIVFYPYKENYVDKKSIDDLNMKVKLNCDTGISAINDPDGYNNLFIHLFDNK